MISGTLEPVKGHITRNPKVSKSDKGLSLKAH